jgi:asparagine synthase (glutamine-hydrolysing)
MHHRGPDGRGVYLDDDARLGLGHARLSVIDLQHGQQPLYSEDGDLVLVCNGEIYDFERIRTDLQAKGHRFATHSDSEVIIHLYQQYGLDFVKHLRGEFAFLLYDKERRELLAVRDRFGIKPLYFNKQRGAYLFASEAKALFATGALEASIDVCALRNILSSVMPDSIFQGVEVVPPACLLRVDLKTSSHECVQYWDVDLAPPEPSKMLQDEAAAMAIVRESVEEAIRLRLRADVPVGVYLSGGIDSAIVAATVARQFPEQIKAFTVAFPDAPRFDEYPLAKNLAEAIGAEFHSVKCDQHVLLENTEGSLWVSELPFLNFHGVGKYLLSALAKKHVTVVLTGEGSDEVFLGYREFTSVARRARKRASPKPGALARQFRDALGVDPEPKFQFWLSGVVQRILRGFFHAKHRDRLRSERPFDVLKRRLQRAQIEGLSPFRSMQYVWMKNLLPHFILSMLGDRAEMAHSVEGRTPFLDHHLFENARRIPDHLKIHDGVEKYVLREAFKHDVTDDIYNRRKWPYAAPPLWIRRGRDAKLDELIDQHLSAEAIERSGIFHLRTLRFIQLLCASIFFDCGVKRVLNSWLVFVLTTQMLDHLYVQEFHKNLEERGAPDGSGRFSNDDGLRYSASVARNSGVSLSCSSRNESCP